MCRSTTSPLEHTERGRRPGTLDNLDRSRDPRQHHATGQAFELLELPEASLDAGANGDVDPREARRARQREEKLARLQAEDEMKFSHSIQFNAVPDWSSHYIAYSNLKKL